MIQQTSLQFFAMSLYEAGLLTGSGDMIQNLLEQAREMYQNEIEQAQLDAKEIVIIKQCAEESTSAAHDKEVHRQQIIAAYIAAKMERNKVKKHFAYFLKLDRVQIAAQEYYNENYGGNNEQR